LEVKATIPGATEEDFQRAAEKAKVNCPISKLMNARITINAQLV
jgi:osmotically inducible protein OsmC